MKANVVGLEYVKYLRKKDNTPVSGISIHIQKDPVPNKANTFKGREVSTVWVSENTKLFDKVRSLPVNADVDLIYDFDGRNSFLSDVKIINTVNNNK